MTRARGHLIKICLKEYFCNVGNSSFDKLQKLHNQFTFSLICKILLLIIILTYYFLITITNIGYLQIFFLLVLYL